MATCHLLLTIIVILVSISSVSCQIAGAGGYSIQLTAPGNVSPTRWASISQSPVKKEWENLTNSFTVQFWAYWNGPGTLNREVIVSRHPGGGELDARSHFAIGLTGQGSFSSDWRLTAWVGCGVAVGFSLTSSVSFPIRSWTRVNLVVTGDGTFDPSAQAFLYQDGQIVDTSSWNVMGCDTRYGIPWDENSADVRLGHYDNQDWIDSSQTSNPFSVYGFNGQLDELSFFPFPVSVSSNQTSYEYLGSEPGLLYFQFNEGPRDPPGFQDFTRKLNPYLTGRAAIENGEGPYGMLVPNDKSGWMWSTLTVNQQVDIRGTNPPLFSTPILNTFSVFPYALPLAPTPTPTSFSTGASTNQPDYVSSQPDHVSSQPDHVTSQPDHVTSQPDDVTTLPLIERSINEIEDSPVVATVSVFITGVSPNLSRALETDEVQIFDVNFVRLTQLPFLLPSARVRVVVKCPNTACDLGDLFFQYSVGASSAFVQLTVRSDCPSGRFDICGECDGDNRTCTCACYHGFRTQYMAYQLFRFGLEQISAQAGETLSTLRKVRDVLQKIPKGQQKISPSFPREVSGQRNFSKCISQFCSAFGDFYGNFTTSLPLAEMTGLPFDTCSCDPLSGSFV